MKQKLIDFYGSEEAYRAEMRRRRSLVKKLKPGFAAMDKIKHLEVSRSGGLKGKKNAEDKDRSSGSAV